MAVPQELLPSHGTPIRVPDFASIPKQGMRWRLVDGSAMALPRQSHGGSCRLTTFRDRATTTVKTHTGELYDNP